MLPPIGYRVSGESTNHVASNLKSTLVSVEVMARYTLPQEKLVKNEINNHGGSIMTLEFFILEFVGVNLSTKKLDDVYRVVITI